MRILALLLVISLVSGCGWMERKGWVRDRADDYRKAKVEPRLKVPDHLEDDNLQDIFVIPPITEEVSLSETFEVPRPTPLVAKESEDLVRIQRLGDEEWMLASVAPGQLWPQVRSFLNSNNVQVARVDARAGLIETGWFKGSGVTMNERYQFRIEQGVQRNTAELHILQMWQAGDINSWPDASADGERSGDMLMAVAQYIANTSESSPVSMMAQQSMGEGGKVSMQEDGDGTPYVQLRLPYYRAWASVDRALRESSFRIRDLDRSSGKFYVRFEPPEEDDGWFDWLFGGDEEDDGMSDQDYLLTVTELEENRVRIDLVREDDAELTIGQRQQLLTLLKGNIN